MGRYFTLIQIIIYKSVELITMTEKKKSLNYYKQCIGINYNYFIIYLLITYLYLGPREKENVSPMHTDGVQRLEYLFPYLNCSGGCVLPLVLLYSVL